MTAIDPPIVRVPIPTEARVTFGTTNAYLVGTDGAALVDPAASSEELKTLVDDRSVDHLLVTHTHSDHVGGVAELAARTGATTYALEGHGSRFERAVGIRPDRTIVDGSTIETGDGAELTVVVTPGHAPDHIALDVPGGTICGDLAIAEGSIFVGGDDGDMRTYLDSMRRIRERNPKRLYPGHGPVITEPRSVIDRLVERRRHRERQILRAVEAGHATDADIVNVVYDRDLEGVRDLAESVVRAHLAKLAEDGAIEWDGTRARPAR